jgi:hypothetical protein
VFEIDLLNQEWLEGCEPASDPCSHGRLRVVMGDTTVADGELDLGISESALGLLRTLDQDRRSETEQDRLILHGCGLILMMGCSIGIDWDVRHDGDMVRLHNVIVCDGTGPEGERDLHVSVEVPAHQYREQVVKLADAVKRFFAAGPEKAFDDAYDRQQYADFWREFDARLAAAR